MKLEYTREVSLEHIEDPKISHCRGFFLFEHIRWWMATSGWC